MHKILILLFILCLFTVFIFPHKAFAEEKDDDFSLEKKDYKMQKKDYETQIVMVLILVALAFVLG